MTEAIAALLALSRLVPAGLDAIEAVILMFSSLSPEQRAQIEKAYADAKAKRKEVFPE